MAIETKAALEQIDATLKHYGTFRSGKSPISWSSLQFASSETGYDVGGHS